MALQRPLVTKSGNIQWMLFESRMSPEPPTWLYLATVSPLSLKTQHHAFLCRSRLSRVCFLEDVWQSNTGRHFLRSDTLLPLGD